MKHKSSLSIIIFLSCVGLFAQQKSYSLDNESFFILKGDVFDQELNKPIFNVNIEVNSGAYTTTNRLGEFSIKTKIGDELVVRSDDFQTVYYQIKDKQRIKIFVEENKQISSKKYIKQEAKKNNHQEQFLTYIDSAKQVLKKDAKKSINFVTKALESIDINKATPLQNSMVFETLGDINLYWKQSDLAVDNYKRSLSYSTKPTIQIKLARAFRANKNYQESIKKYRQLLNEKLTNYQRIEVFEGLGDTYKSINDVENSVVNYEKGLEIAQKHKIIPKVTDLNSKLGEIFAQSGDEKEAEAYFGNSLKLAKKENQKRAVTQKNIVADFYNKNSDYDKEIELREEAISEIQALDEKENYPNDNPLTLQRQNYKIANALISQEQYQKAVSYLKKSIKEAHQKNDLVVEKDATRKLSEAYKVLGNDKKASENYQKYVALLDKLYIKKEQDISQAARFSKEISKQQNRILSLESDRKLNETRYELAIKNKELLQKSSLIQKWIIGSLILIALLLLFAFYSQYKNSKQQKFANNLLALKSMRSQMNPHFIFNALNSVNSFIAVNDERAANKYLSEFSQLMRSVLENSEQDFIPLEKEIELLKLYVKLEHFRFQDKFEYSIEIDSNILLKEYEIPPMLLQPYVENAVWHGLRYKKEKGFLHIIFKKIDNKTIQIVIEDNGIGREKSKAFKTENQKKQRSKGMSNIKKRIAILNTMYKDKVDVTIEDLSKDEDDAGTRVVLYLKKDTYH